MHYDAESVWALVQRHGGAVSIRGDCRDFLIDPKYSALLILAWPLLRRLPNRDYL